MRNTLSRALTLAALTAGLSFVAVPAQALPIFTIDPSEFADEAEFDADRIVGGYTERFTVTGPGQFHTDAFYNVGQFFLESEEISGGESGEGVEYDLYAVFSADGTFAPNDDGGFTFTAEPGDGEVTLFVDRNRDTDLSLPAAGGVDRDNTGDDDILATAVLFGGSGDTREGDNNGDFSLTFNPFVLTALGSQYFVRPQPFYLELLLEGQFNTFVPEGSQIIRGSADASFDRLAPEPASMALFGIGLFGAAVAARRRQKMQA